MLLYRKFLFIFLMGFLFFPLIQDKFHLIIIKPLSGTHQLTEDTGFSYHGWFSGKYQAHEEEYLKDTFGLRNLIIRAHNQIDYSFFKKTIAGDVVVGKKDDLFILWYLETYNGTDFSGSKSIDARLTKLKYLQDTLAKLNKTLLIVFAPSKVTFSPENIPDEWIKSDSTNYSVMVKLIKVKCLNYIDFNKYFTEQKNKSKYPLFSHYGIHWSAYGACVAGDSILNIIEKLRTIKLLHPQWRNTVVTEKANNDETELENELNLVFPLKYEMLGHPHAKNIADISNGKPSALFVGDSFFWGLEKYYTLWSCFSSLTLYHNKKMIYYSGDTTTHEIKNYSLNDELKQNDIFIIEATEPNLSTLGGDFLDFAYKALYPAGANGKPLM
jgi:hypothetical protein